MKLRNIKAHFNLDKTIDIDLIRKIFKACNATFTIPSHPKKTSVPAAPSGAGCLIHSSGVSSQNRERSSHSGILPHSDMFLTLWREKYL